MHISHTLIVLLTMFVLIVALGATAWAATITSTAAGGVWSATTTWVNGVVPVAADNVVIATTGANYVNGNDGGTSYTCASLTINSGATLTMWRPFTVTTTTSISGTINFGSTSGTNRTMTFTGDVTLNSGAVWNETATGAVAIFSFGGNLTNNATTFTAQNNATAVHTFTGTAKMISGTTVTAIPYLTINGTTTNNGTLTVSSILAGTSTLTNGATGVLNIGGTAGITTLTTTTAGNTVNYNGAAAQTLHTGTYVNLTLSGGGIKTTTTVTVNGILSMEGTATASVVPTYGAAATLQYNKPAAFTSGVEWLTPFAGTGGIIIANTGVITTSAAKVLSASVPLIINTGANLTTGATFALTVGGATTVTGTFTLASTGTKTFTGDVTVNSGGVWNETGVAAINYAGNLQNDGTTFTASTGVHTFSGATKTISGATAISIPTATFTGSYSNNGTLTVGTLLTVTGTTLTNNGTITASTALSGTGGLTQATNATLNIGGTSGITTLTATASGNTVNYTGAAQTVHVNNYWSLGLSGSLAKTLNAGITSISGDFTMGGSATATGLVGLTIGGNVILDGTSTFTSGAYTHNVGGAIALNTGTLNLGSGTLNLTGDLSGAGTLTGSTGTINIGGNWTHSGTFTANTSIVNYNGNSTDQIVRGGITYYNLQISNGSSKLLQIGDATVSNILTLNSGVFKINDYNLLLNNTAIGAIAGSPYSISNMVQTDGVGYLQKAGGANGAGINIVYPVGSGGYYNPLDLSSGFTATSGTGNIQISATTDNQGANALSKYWTLTFTGGYATATGITTNLRFTYDNAEVHGAKSQYDTWYNSGSSWISAPGTHTSLGANPFGTNVSGVTAASITGKWTAGSSAPSTSISYYSYQSGDWAAATSWTSDPSGTLWINPGVPTGSDNVTILNGRTISINTNNKQVTTLTMNSGGILDIASTAGHNFGTVTGQGKIMLSSNSLPDGTYTSFVASSGGTVEYYNLNGVAISTTQFTYNNLIVSNYTGSANSAFLINSANPTTYVINGNFSLKNYSTGTHTLNFGNSTASDNLINMTVYGNLSVDAGCNIRVNNFAGVHNIPNVNDEGATPYPVHTLNLYGNFTNNGSVRFTGLPSPFNNAYYLLTTTAYPWGGANNYGDVQVFFKGATNNTVTCNNTTDFFRIIVEKGTDKTYTLEVNSSSTNNFALYAPNNQGNDQFAGGTNGYGFGAYYKALFIHYGTLKLNENINIPSLTERGTDGGAYIGGQDFNLIPTAELWINGANVSTTLTGVNGTGYQAATLYGSLRVSAGQFSTGDAAGIVLGTLGTPVILVEGTGILDVSQAWTSTGGTNQMSYIQTGGTANFRLLGENHAGPMLGLSNINSVFIMSGGVINFTNNTFIGGTTYDYQIMDIESQVGAYQVTGGTINLNLPSSATVYTANSTVPFYNLNISRGTGAVTTIVQWNTPGPSLNVLHDLSIGANSLLNLNTSLVDLTVGHNFSILLGGTYTPATGLTNTTTLNGNGSQTFDASGTITGNLQNLTLTNTADVTLNSNNVTIIGNLTIGHGTILRDNGRTIFVQGNIVNSGTHFKPASGAGSIQLTGIAAQTLSGDGTGSFNNLTLNKTGGSTTTTADLVITGELRLANTAARLSIGSNLLALGTDANVYDALAGTSQIFSAARMIYTNGLMSDNGMSKVFSSTTAFNFPFGFYNTLNTTYYYMPHSVQFSSPLTAYGTVTTRPVNARHPLTQSTNSLACYWKTTSTDFTGVPTGSVIHNYYYDPSLPISKHFVSGTETNYIPAVYLGNSTWNTINNVALVTEATNQVSYNAADSAGGEYTAGEPAAFAAVPARYSTGVNGDWDNTATWSATAVGGPGGASVPGAATLVIIGDATHNHTVTISANNKQCANLNIAAGSALDLQTYTGHNFGVVPDNGMAGSGTLRIASNNYFPQGDFGAFIAGNGGTIEYYTSATVGNITIPTTSASGLVLSAYKNLKLTHSSTYTITLPDRDLTIYGDVTVSGSGTGSAGTNTITSRTYTVNGNLNINSGAFEFRNVVISTMKVLGNTNIAAGATFRAATTGAVINNILELDGNLSCAGTGTFDMNNTGRVYTYFKGAADDTISGAGTIDFYNLFVDKGFDTTSVLTVTANSISTGTIPFLTLSNGTFRVNNSSLNLTLSTTTSFSIPSTACLSVQTGTVTIGTTNDAGDLLLAGKLEVLGGTVNIGNGGATNNDIEYASAGLPEVNIAGGQLIVNGQIRRGTSITSGSLNYTQSGGTVTIGGKNPSTSRAAFEVLNDGSKFDMSGGTLIIANHISTSSPYDLYIEPDVSNVTGGTIQLGQSGVTANNTLFYFESSVPLGNLTLEATSNSQAIQQIYDLTLIGNLTIGGTSSYYNTNGLDLEIGGNLTNNNTTAASNGLNVGGFRTQVLTQTTSFLGNVDQTITGTATPNRTNFANLEVATAQGHTLFLSNTTPSNITVNGDLTLTSGIFNDGGNIINLLNNVDNNAAHFSPNAASGGMIFNGTVNQGLTGSGSGVFGNIEINNGGNGINMTDNSTINGQLKFTNGYLYIDNYGLTLGQSVTIAGTINVTNQIILNGVSGDHGVTKIFPTGASSFTFHMGDNGKYTPCTFNFTSNANAAGATITVVPVDELHPSIDPASYLNYLNYYWKVVTTGFSSSAYNVTHTYTYVNAEVEGNPANIERCDNSTSGWSTVAGTISPPTFSFSSASLLDGSYTIGDQFASLPPATSTKSGNWNDPTVWSTGSIPNGNSVIIRSQDSVALSANGANASSVIVNGVLDAENTTFHNLGIVSGGGKIKLLGTGAGMFVFPGGSYNAFFANPACTIEYYGNTNCTMPLTPGNINMPYQNVILSGTGLKYISSVNMQINGNLTISPNSTLDNTLYNKDLIALGNWIDQNTSTGGFNAGTGAVRFNGTTAQNIIMANSSMKETFYNLAINNTSGVTINTGNVDVSNQLILTLGNINFASSSNNLTITNTNTNAIVDGSVNSFVNGPLRKKINNGSSFQFPVGDANSSGRNRIGYVSVSNTAPSGSQIWTAQFFDKNPTTDGYDITKVTLPLNSVVYNEYWNIIGPTGGSANVGLNWDQYTGMSSSAQTRALSMVAEWNTPVSSSWNSVGQVVTDFGQYLGTVATSTPVSLENHIFTIGATSPPVASLITATQSGLWNSLTTWGNVRVPGPNDTAKIVSPFTVTLDANVTVAKLVVNTGSTFNTSTYTLTVTGGFVLDGTWAGAGTISLTTSSDSLYGSGSMTGTSILEIAGTNKAIASTANLTLTNVSILTGKTLTNKGTVTINILTGADVTSRFENKPGATLIFNGPNLATITLVADVCPNTVIYNSSGAQAVSQAIHCNIIMRGGGPKTVSGTILTAHGDVIQEITVPVTPVTVDASVIWQIDGALVVGEGFINNGDITINN